jgi:quercetin dioxygenase-like cupin family protein
MTYPRTITSITGETLTFHGIKHDEQGEYLEVSNEVAPGAGPPMHVHYRQDEGLTVVAGRIGHQIAGGKEQFAGVGETVVFKAGVAHRFWNAGTDTLRCTGFVRPADNLVYFLSNIYQSANENGGRPGLKDSAFLMHRYSNEFGMLEIPAFVQKGLFPVARFIGNVSGYYAKRFADAPPRLK